MQAARPFPDCSMAVNNSLSSRSSRATIAVSTDIPALPLASFCNSTSRKLRSSVKREASALSASSRLACSS